MPVYLLNSFTITNSFPALILFLVILLLILGIYIFYRRTIPDLNKKDKFLLAFLRIIALLLIILSLGEFVVEFITKKIERPVTIVLIDNSKSVEKERELIIKEVNNIIKKLKSSNQSIEIYKFDNNVEEISIDSLHQIDFSGSSTNISNAINKILSNKGKKNYQNLILISDGIYNTGENPLYISEKSEIPFFVLGVGDPNPIIDISINEIVTNDIIFAQNQTPVRVSIKSNGFENQSVTIQFFEDNRLLEKRNYIIQGNYQELEFIYTPKTDGEKKLTFQILPLKNEFTIKNNSASKYVKILSNKIRVLTIAGKPSYDLSFFNQIIKSNNDLQLGTLIEKPNGEFYPLFNNENFLDSADVIFFIGFPSNTNSEKFIRKIFNKIDRDNTPIFTLINPETDFNRLTQFIQFLPFSWRSAYGTSSQIFIDVPEEKSKNEILNVDGENSASIWNSLPPINRIDREFINKPESELLAYYKISNQRVNQPLITTRNLNRHRSIAFIGFNLWRLKLLNAMKEEESIYLDRFINNSIKWLTAREIQKNFTVKLNKKIFDLNEKVKFIAQLYDDSNMPVDDAQINLEIHAKESTVTNTVFKPLGNGIYIAEFEELPQGDYNFQANVEISNKKLSDQGKFSVMETELEYRDFTLKEDLLKKLSTITNGQYFHILQSNEFVKNIDRFLLKKEKELETSKTFYLWNSPYTLAMSIILLSIEWYLRKKWGLI